MSDQAHGSLVQNENQGQTGRSKQKGGIKKSKAAGNNPNRYGLLDIGEQASGLCEKLRFRKSFQGRFISYPPLGTVLQNVCQNIFLNIARWLCVV